MKYITIFFIEFPRYTGTWRHVLQSTPLEDLGLSQKRTVALAAGSLL